MSDTGSVGERSELIEVERELGAAGHDGEASLDDRGRATCPACGAPNDLSGLLGSGRAARDTATDRDELEVLAYRCGSCDAALRTTVDRDESGAQISTGAGEPTSAGRGGPAAPISDTSGEPTPSGRPDVPTVDRPVSHASFRNEVDRFEATGPGSLRDQGSLIDEDGDDIRMYTGEPVETDEGWVLPVQQNFAGRDNIAGGGEWPDPHAPPAQQRPVDEDDRPDAEA